MKIAVIGGTGLIGSQVVKILNASGHEAVPYSLATGLDLLTGQGLPEAFKDASVVVNVANSPTFDDASLSFFQTSMDNLLSAASAAEIRHAVVLSIVGADEVPGLVYYRAKVLQEDLLKAGPFPYSIVRATQFFEFIDTVVMETADDNTVRLPATPIQPIASADVAQPWPTSAQTRHCAALAPWPALMSSRSTNSARLLSPRRMTIAPLSPTTRLASSRPSQGTH
jgi:uncharacterized protein YbjT (DUF2867 family)